MGNDGFGDINIHRLAADGVDIRGISVLPLEATGSAFVTYHNSGDREILRMPLAVNYRRSMLMKIF
ncbi:Fructokinase [Shigella dysenteriae CDC 74-1112]|nr:Fructokinase [Shigella dysenteriae CDC 74-1112]